MQIKRLLAVVFDALVFTGCSNTTTVTVPVAPRVDLSAYQTVGLITVTSAPASNRLAILRSATAPPPITRQRRPFISR